MRNNSLYYFEQAPVSKAIINFGVPIMIAMLVTIIYNLVDTFYIGLLGDPHLLAAVTLALPLFTVFMALGNIFGLGCSNSIARLLGEKNFARIRHTTSWAFYGSLTAGLVVTLVGFALLDPLLDFLGTSPDTLGPTRSYVTVLMAGGILTMLSFCLSQIVRAEGAAKVSMLGNILGTATNIILDPIFIFALGWGIAGAAFATVIANCLIVAYYAHYILRKSPYLSLAFKGWLPDIAMLRDTLSIGSSAFLLNVLMIAATLVQNNVAAIFGDIYVAIFGIIFKVNMLPKFLARGLCQGVQPLMGYASSAGNYARLHAIVRVTGLYSSLLSIIIGAVFFAAGGAILHIFIQDDAIVKIGTPLFRIALLSYLTYGIVFLSTSLFQATGKAIPAFAMALSQGAVYIPVVLAASSTAGIMGFVWALPLADVMTLILGMVFYGCYKNRIYAEAKSHPLVPNAVKAA